MTGTLEMDREVGRGLSGWDTGRGGIHPELSAISDAVTKEKVINLARSLFGENLSLSVKMTLVAVLLLHYKAMKEYKANHHVNIVLESNSLSFDISVLHFGAESIPSISDKFKTMEIAMQEHIIEVGRVHSQYLK